MPHAINMEESWRVHLSKEFESPYMTTLREFLMEEKKKEGFFPPAPLIFNAFNQTPFERVKVVILGQDPYHGEGQAMGLSFSVPEGIKHPPSLRNIFKERETDLGLAYPSSGDLTPWAKRGVLLLNTTLTVRPHQPRSHYGRGWEHFTQAAINALSKERTGIAFVLWGRDAQDRGEEIDLTKHGVFSSTHPSPFSSHRGFFGSKPFSKVNSYLERQEKSPIDWTI
jgi:uracil-DNA glycosylase